PGPILSWAITEIRASTAGFGGALVPRRSGGRPAGSIGPGAGKVVGSSGYEGTGSARQFTSQTWCAGISRRRAGRGDQSRASLAASRAPPAHPAVPPGRSLGG